MANLNIQEMRLDRIQTTTFSDMISFKLSNDHLLRFSEFQKVCGISREQWDLFRANNREAKLKWEF
jgi:hypothetical protein